MKSIVSVLFVVLAVCLGGCNAGSSNPGISGPSTDQAIAGRQHLQGIVYVLVYGSDRSRLGVLFDLKTMSEMEPAKGSAKVNPLDDPESRQRVLHALKLVVEDEGAWPDVRAQAYRTTKYAVFGEPGARLWDSSPQKPELVDGLTKSVGGQKFQVQGIRMVPTVTATQPVAKN